jgi:hypothetical protein
VRDERVYASTDGQGTLSIAPQGALDRDDCLAQMVFHELCHSLIEGPESLRKPDWGLDNETGRDVPREHACLRVQAALADPLGLRRFLAPTTDFRLFYDALSANPLAPRTDATVQLARIGLGRATRPPWAPFLHDALETTARIAAATSLLSEPSLPSLYDVVDPPWPRHPSGFSVAPYYAREGGCGTCAWRFVGGPGRPVDRCRQADSARVRPDMPACERWEPALNCLECGACCRAAYDSVTISGRESLVSDRPDLVVRRPGYWELRRSGDHCAALAEQQPFLCSVYPQRPQTCRDFARGGNHCLTARRRLGLSL